MKQDSSWAYHTEYFEPMKLNEYSSESDREFKKEIQLFCLKNPHPIGTYVQSTDDFTWNNTSGVQMKVVNLFLRNNDNGPYDDAEISIQQVYLCKILDTNEVIPVWPEEIERIEK